MYSDPAQALEALKRLDLPAILVDIWEGRAPRRISIQYKRPSRFFREGVAVPDKEFCVPIVERNGETIFAFNLRDRSYFVHNYGDQQPELSGATFQQLAAWMLVDLGYAGLEDIALEFAFALDFEHTERLTRWLREDDDTDAVIAKEEFVASLKGKGHAS